MQSKVSERRELFVEWMTTYAFTYEGLLRYEEHQALSLFFDGEPGWPGAAELAASLGYTGCIYRVIDTSTGQVFLGRTKHLIHSAVFHIQDRVDAGAGGAFFDAIRCTPHDMLAVQVLYVQWEPSQAEHLAEVMTKMVKERQSLTFPQRLVVKADAKGWLSAGSHLAAA